MATATKPKAKPKADAKAEAKPKTITVKIGAFPGGQIKSYTMKVGSTYAEGIAQAELGKAAGLDIRVDGQRISDPEAQMSDGEQILVFSKIRGNN